MVIWAPPSCLFCETCLPLADAFFWPFFAQIASEVLDPTAEIAGKPACRKPHDRTADMVRAWEIICASIWTRI